MFSVWTILTHSATYGWDLKVVCSRLLPISGGDSFEPAQIFQSSVLSFSTAISSRTSTLSFVVPSKAGADRRSSSASSMACSADSRLGLCIVQPPVVELCASCADWYCISCYSVWQLSLSESLLSSCGISIGQYSRGLWSFRSGSPCLRS